MLISTFQGKETPQNGKNKVSVTGAFVHAPRQRNSTYVHTVRWSIYKTRRPDHPHSPIRQYERRPQGPPSRPCYM